MTTRSIFIGAIKSIETVTRSFTFTHVDSPRKYEVAVPEGGLILSGWAQLGATNPDGKVQPKSPMTSGLSASGNGWLCEVPNLWHPDFIGFDWTAEVTLTVTYAVPA
ncbi:hypothetical protein [Streptomyces huiliensis]|uniref:hypothetical protein n=1 Tax=Streptomyces huiliensis TaxID=2876027 RepID=UPI001CBEC48A|nr:hypothetical protein [Streptomyces huiliensis]MBZ4320623.1 hypothetical protein [Streptomyces huiliensis]